MTMEPILGDPDAMAKKNAVVCGRVAKVLRNGVLVALPNDKTGLVHLTEMCDTFIDNLLDEFKTKIDTFVRYRSISCSPSHFSECKYFFDILYKTSFFQ